MYVVFTDEFMTRVWASVLSTYVRGIEQLNSCQTHVTQNIDMQEKFHKYLPTNEILQ